MPDNEACPKQFRNMNEQSGLIQNRNSDDKRGKKKKKKKRLRSIMRRSRNKKGKQLHESVHGASELMRLLKENGI